MRIALALLLILLPVMLAAQDAPPPPQVNCANLEQCRVLVLVTRAQLQTAQESWAFWASLADTLQQQLVAMKKETAVKADEKGQTSTGEAQ